MQVKRVSIKCTRCKRNRFLKSFYRTRRGHVCKKCIREQELKRYYLKRYGFQKRVVRRETKKFVPHPGRQIVINPELTMNIIEKYCSIFGCGKKLTLIETLCGDYCITHMGKRKVIN